MKKWLNRYGLLHKTGWLAGVMMIAVVISLHFFPVKKSYAICETMGDHGSAVSSTLSGQSAYIATLVQRVETAVETALTTAETTLIAGFEAFHLAFTTKLGQFWEAWLQNYMDMTAQLHTAMLDQTRTVISSQDAANQITYQQQVQLDELEARQRYTPSEESCVFDSTMPAAGRAEQVSRAAATALSSEISSGFMNDSTLEHKTPAARTRNEWENYVNLFCNAGENSGTAPCEENGSRVDADINISHTLFGRDTLFIEEPEDALALQAAMFNLMGRPKASVVPEAALENLMGRTAFLQKRAQAAQLNVSASIMGDIIGERLPLGAEVPEFREMRVAEGIPEIEVSDQPSKYEMRQAYLEFVNSPSFFKRLGDNSAALAQKDIHLKALKLMTLNDLISKTERLTTLFAVDLANKLDTTETSR